MSFQWFGHESFTGALSFYYKKGDYEKYKKFSNALIMKYDVGKGKIFGDFIKLVVKQGFITMNVKIYTSKNKEIAKIIKNNS